MVVTMKQVLTVFCATNSHDDGLSRTYLTTQIMKGTYRHRHTRTQYTHSHAAHAYKDTQAHVQRNTHAAQKPCTSVIQKQNAKTLNRNERETKAT